MTIEQLYNLDEQEIMLCLYVVNVLSPVKGVGELPPRGLTWFRRGELEKKLLAAFNHVKPEAHAIYSSLLTKLNIQHEIKYEQPPTGSATP